MIICKQNEGVAELRRTYFHCVDATDGITPATGEAGGQPQLSFRGGSWQDSSGTLTAIGNGRYYLELHPAEINTSGVIESRYKSANTAETLGIPIQVMPWNPYDTSNLGLSTLSSFSFNDANVNANIVQTSGNLFNVDDFKADVSAIPTNPMLDTEDGSSFTAIPDMATETKQDMMMGYVDTEVAAIKVQTDKFQFDGNNRVLSSGDYVTDVNVVRLSGDLVAINDFRTDISSIPTNPMLDTEDGSSFAAIPDMATETKQDMMIGYVDTEVGAIKTQTDKLTFDSSNRVVASGDWTTTDVSSDVSSIKTQTDKFQFDGNNRVLASGDYVTDVNVVRLSGELVHIDDFKADVSTLASQSDVTLIKTQTDKMTFDSNNRIESSGAYTVDANLVRVSGELIHINDLKYSETDIYYADIKYVKDMINSQDEIGVQWFKNMTPVTSVTNPYISLYNTSNGSAVVEHTSMTAAGTTGAYRYNLTSNLFASGEPYLVITSGTIDGALREWRHVVGIDKL